MREMFDRWASWIVSAIGGVVSFLPSATSCLTALTLCLVLAQLCYTILKIERLCRDKSRGKENED
jgi:hypothetical protein